jgi:hypothetical protein
MVLAVVAAFAATSFIGFAVVRRPKPRPDSKLPVGKA